MQRRRRDQVGVGQEVGAGDFEPADEKRRRFQPARVLVGQDDRPARIVIGERRAGAIEPGRTRRAGAADAVSVGALGQEAEAAATAERFGDELEPGPAAAADRLGRRRLNPAPEAAGRNDQIEDGGERPGGCAQNSLKLTRSSRSICLIRSISQVRYSFMKSSTTPLRS